MQFLKLVLWKGQNMLLFVAGKLAMAIVVLMQVQTQLAHIHDPQAFVQAHLPLSLLLQPTALSFEALVLRNIISVLTLRWPCIVDNILHKVMFDAFDT